MNTVRFVLATLGMVAVVVAPSAQAQSLTSAQTTDFRIAIGAAFPQGDRLSGPQSARPFGSNGPPGVDVAGGAKTGFTIAGSVGIMPVNSLIGYRLEAQYTNFGLGDETRIETGGEAPIIANGHVSSLSGTGNIVLAAPTASRLRPYLIGGLGIYRLSSEIDYRYPSGGVAQSGIVPWVSDTKFGLNGGAGMELAMGSLRSFVEARRHSVFTKGEKANFIPITIGMKL